MKKLLMLLMITGILIACNDSNNKTTTESTDSSSTKMNEGKPADHAEAVRIADSATNALWDSTNKVLDSNKRK